MGKSRRSRGNAAHRKDPIAKAVKPPSDPELIALRESRILPVVKDLQSSDPKSRSAAATAISSIIEDSRCRKLLLRERVVHIVLTQTLTDTALESRAAGWGILQVLAQEEDADFCVHLFRLDVLTAIASASKTVVDKLQSKDPDFRKLPKAEQGFISSIASSLVSLLTALAEAQDEILESISQNDSITDLLFTIVTYTSPEEDAVTALRDDALACLMILCEDNAGLSKIIVSENEDGPYRALMRQKENVTGEGVLSCGILHNIFASLSEDEDDVRLANMHDAILIPTLSKTIATIDPGQVAANGGGWSNPFECRQLALEVLASIGTSLFSTVGKSGAQKEELPNEAKDDEDMGDAEEELPSDQEDGGGDEDDEMGQDEMGADMDMVTGAGDDEDGIDDLPTLKTLLQTALPELIRIARTQPSDEDSLRLQSHALSALNNIAWSLSVVDFSDDHNAGIQKAWLPLARSIWDEVIGPILSSDTADLNLATQVTGLAWALARALKGSTTPAAPDQQYHRKFISLYQATRGSHGDDEDPFQSLGVKCIGVLGQLALDPAPLDLNREIGTFFVTLLTGLPDTPAADAVEALNQVFDVYGDEGAACDKEVFWRDGFAKHLEEVLPKARGMAKKVDRKQHAELKTRADEAVMNLTRFLAYKRKHKP